MGGPGHIIPAGKRRRFRVEGHGGRSVENHPAGGRFKSRTLEWLALADADLGPAEILQGRPKPYPHLVCFLGQQAAEKYPKAFLEERGIEPPKTHGLAVPLDPAKEGLKPLLPLREEPEKLTEFAEAARCPGVSADPGAADQAVKIARLVGYEVKRALGIESP